MTTNGLNGQHRYAFGFSTDQPTNFSGIHTDWVLNRSADENYMPDAGLCWPFTPSGLIFWQSLRKRARVLLRME